MLRWFCLFACLYMLLSAGAAFADTVTLRARVEANGPQVTIGDVFEGAPATIAGRPIAPAPAPGQVGTLSAPLLAAVASAAGLEWTPPAGVSEIRVVRPGGARALVGSGGGASGGGRMVADAAIRRGESVTLVYEAPGLSLTMRTRALQDGAIGQPIQLLNTSSNRTIDAIVTGRGAARATP